MRFYTGISEDPQHRLEQHNSGQFKGWTSKFGPWALVFTEKHPDYRSDRIRERELKAQKGGLGFFAKTGLNPELFVSKDA